MGLVENDIYDIAVAATTCRPGADRRVLLKCINATMQPQEQRPVSLIGIFLPVHEDEMQESSSLGQSTGVQGIQAMAQCPEHMTTLLEQALRVYQARAGSKDSTNAHCLC